MINAHVRKKCKRHILIICPIFGKYTKMCNSGVTMFFKNLRQIQRLFDYLFSDFFNLQSSTLTKPTKRS